MCPTCQAKKLYDREGPNAATLVTPDLSKDVQDEGDGGPVMMRLNENKRVRESKVRDQERTLMMMHLNG